MRARKAVFSHPPVARRVHAINRIVDATPEGDIRTVMADVAKLREMPLAAMKGDEMTRFQVRLAFLAGFSVCASPAGAGDLTGTSWRLVEIQSMDDSVDALEDSTPLVRTSAMRP